MDDKLNMVARPGCVLATNGINVMNNEKETLILTFNDKAKKILPNTKIEDLTDRFSSSATPNIIEKDIIGLVYRNDTTKWFFETQEHFKHAVMLFTYHGCWATFHHDSTEKHMRAALGAWKRELYLNARQKGINVRRFDEATDENLAGIISKLKDDEYVMLFLMRKQHHFLTVRRLTQKNDPALSSTSNII